MSNALRGLKRAKAKNSHFNMNAYDTNKMMMKKLPVMAEEELNEAFSNIILPYMPGTEKYFMLLCRERNDYTIFSFKTPYDTEKYMNELFGTLQDRGEIQSIHKNEDNVIEIWVKIQDESYAYYLFDYAMGVIEI